VKIALLVLDDCILDCSFMLGLACDGEELSYLLEEQQFPKIRKILFNFQIVSDKLTIIMMGIGKKIWIDWRHNLRRSEAWRLSSCNLYLHILPSPIFKINIQL